MMLFGKSGIYAVLLTGAVFLLTVYSCKQLKRNTTRDRQDQKTYYHSGILKSETVRGKKDGYEHVILYYAGGAIQSDCSYAGGVEGPCIQYFENGKILMCYFYKDHQPEGRAYSNYANGKTAYERFYKDGYKTGTWKYYNEDGSLSEEVRFQERKTPCNDEHDFSDNHFYFNNKLIYTVAVRNGVKTDTVIHDLQAFMAQMPHVPATGKSLFTGNCTQCHNLVRDEVGPMMKGVTRARNREWLVKMITNGQELIQNGDTEAVALFEKWGKIQHPDFSDELSSQQVLQIIDYLETVD